MWRREVWLSTSRLVRKLLQWCQGKLMKPSGLEDVSGKGEEWREILKGKFSGR